MGPGWPAGPLCGMQVRGSVLHSLRHTHLPHSVLGEPRPNTAFCSKRAGAAPHHTSQGCFEACAFMGRWQGQAEVRSPSCPMDILTAQGLESSPKSAPSPGAQWGLLPEMHPGSPHISTKGVTSHKVFRPAPQGCSFARNALASLSNAPAAFILSHSGYLAEPPEATA